MGHLDPQEHIMASGTSRCFTGAFVGTGASLTISKIGFKPRRVELFNGSDPAIGHYTEDMPAGYVAKQVDGTTSFATSNGVTLTDTGFTIGADTDLNVSGETTYFTAWE